MSANQERYSGGQWPGGVRITTTRQQAASPPLGGAMDLQFNGQTVTGKSGIKAAK